MTFTRSMFDIQVVYGEAEAGWNLVRISRDALLTYFLQKKGTRLHSSSLSRC